MQRIKEVFRYTLFAFYPKNVLVVCGIMFIILVGGLSVVIINIPQDSVFYDIALALITGAAASFFVSFSIELSTNYRRNKIAFNELFEYYSAVTMYRIDKYVQMNPLIDDSTGFYDGEDTIDCSIKELLSPKDSIQAVWIQLPKLMPLFSIILETKLEYLNDREREEIKSIVSEINTIRRVTNTLMLDSGLLYNALNHPDEGFLGGLYPQNIINDMPDWMRKHLAKNESVNALNRLSNIILEDEFLIERFLGYYDISESSLERISPDESFEYYDENESDYIDEDEYSYEEETYENEEEFKKSREEYRKYSIERNKPFVSWLFSNCCKRIDESMSALEEQIRKKPYYGILLQKTEDEHGDSNTLTSRLKGMENE